MGQRNEEVRTEVQVSVAEVACVFGVNGVGKDAA